MPRYAGVWCVEEWLASATLESERIEPSSPIAG